MPLLNAPNDIEQRNLSSLLESFSLRQFESIYTPQSKFDMDNVLDTFMSIIGRADHLTVYSITRTHDMESTPIVGRTVYEAGDHVARDRLWNILELLDYIQNHPSENYMADIFESSPRAMAAYEELCKEGYNCKVESGKMELAKHIWQTKINFSINNI